MARRKPPAFKRAGRFIQRHVEWLESPAYRAMSCSARCLLEEFQRVYFGYNNGQLSISNAKARQLLGISEHPVREAFRDLEEHGFIALRAEADYRAGMVREYRLTFEPMNGREPKDEWKHWSPGNPVVRRRRPKKIRLAPQNPRRTSADAA